METRRDWEMGLDGFAPYRLIAVDDENVRLQQLGAAGEEEAGVTIPEQVAVLLFEALFRMLLKGP